MEEEEAGEAAAPKTVKKTVWDWEVLNDNKAIWLRSPSDVSEKDYDKFYKAISKARCPTLSCLLSKHKGCSSCFCVAQQSLTASLAACACHRPAQPSTSMPWMLVACRP